MPVNRLDEWKDWLVSNGFEVVTTPVSYSPFGVKIGKNVYRVYVRSHTHAGNETVHASIHGELIQYAKKFLRDAA